MRRHSVIGVFLLGCKPVGSLIQLYELGMESLVGKEGECVTASSSVLSACFMDYGHCNCYYGIPRLVYTLSVRDTRIREAYSAVSYLTAHMFQRGHQDIS
jgi:hypothetical protein